MNIITQIEDNYLEIIKESFDGIETMQDMNDYFNNMRKIRNSKCSLCNYRNPNNGICKKNLKYLSAYTKFPQSSCPIKEWREIVSKESLERFESDNINIINELNGEDED